MNQTPLVTVIIPCYNHAKYVAECIDSVVAQTYQNIELIIIDDGSKDSSVEVISSKVAECNERFSKVIFIPRENRGLCNTLNQAVNLAQGEYVSTIASDDAILPEKISLQVEYLSDKPDCAAVFGGVVIVDSKGQLVRNRISRPGKFIFKDVILQRHTFIAPTQLIRLTALKGVGLYDPAIYIEDWYMWLKLTNAGYELHDMGQLLSVYRRHDSNMSGNTDKMALARAEILAAYKDNPLYAKGISAVTLSSAIDMQFGEKLLALNYSWRNFSCEWLKSRRFYFFVLKFFVPHVILSKRYGVANGA